MTAAEERDETVLDSFIQVMPDNCMTLDSVNVHYATFTGSCYHDNKCMTIVVKVPISDPIFHHDTKHLSPHKIKDFEYFYVY